MTTKLTLTIICDFVSLIYLDGTASLKQPLDVLSHFAFVFYSALTLRFNLNTGSSLIRGKLFIRKIFAPNHKTWEEFSDALAARFFSPEVHRQWINSLRDMRQTPDQTVEDLAGQLDLHFTRLKITSDNDKSNHLLNALNPEIGDELLINPQKNYEDSVRAAIRFETVLHRKRDREIWPNGSPMRAQWSPPDINRFPSRTYHAPKISTNDSEVKFLTKKIQELEISLADRRWLRL